MSDNKKYYYLKLKDNFFDSDEMIVLESQQDGYLYSNILLKLYLRSLKYNGRLMFNDRIPFNSNMLSNVTRQPVGVVEKAMKLFQSLGLVDVMDNGAIFMSDIQNFIGESSTEADRIRSYRNKIQLEKETNVQMYDISTPEIELKIDLDKENRFKDNKTFSSDSDEYRLSNLLYELMLINNPKAKNPNIQSWCKNIDLLLRVDKRDSKEVERIIRWCQKDGFWRTNILSTGKLREKYDQLTLRMESTLPQQGVNTTNGSYFDEIIKRDTANRKSVEINDEELL